MIWTGETANRQTRKRLDPNGPKLVFGVLSKPFKRMAGTTRLELATSAVTGQRSNQLNYVPTCFSYGYRQTRMFAVHSCCQPFRRFQLFPPDLSKFREKWTAWTARQTCFHTARV